MQLLDQVRDAGRQVGGVRGVAGGDLRVAGPDDVQACSEGVLEGQGAAHGAGGQGCRQTGMCVCVFICVCVHVCVSCVCDIIEEGGIKRDNR